MSRSTILLTVLAITGLGPVSDSAASWTAPAPVSQLPGVPTDLTLTGGLDGSVLATWWQREDDRGSVRAAWRDPAGAWGAAAPLGPDAISRPAPLRGARMLALGGGDPGVDGGVRAWTGRSGTLPFRDVAVGCCNWDLPVVDSGPDGDALAAWTWEQPRRGARGNLRPRVVVVARRAANGRWGAPRRISPLPPAPPYGGGRGPALSATSATVALGGNRVAVVAWQREGVVEARISRDGGRSFGRVQRLGRTSFGHPRPGVDVGAGGSYAVGWSTAPAKTGGTRTLRSVLATGTRSGRGFRRPLVLGSGDADPMSLEPATDQFGARVLVRIRAGGGMVAWQEAALGRVGVRAARFTSTSVGPPIVDVAAPEGGTAVLQDLVAGDALAAVAWAAVRPEGTPGAAFAQAWRRGGPVTPPEELASGGSGVRLGLAGRDLVAAWLSPRPRQAVVASTWTG